MGGVRRLAWCYQALVALLSGAVERADARDDLTRCTRRFSGSIRRTLDDKLTLSITLLRAGEVAAARRLIDDIESQVRAEGRLLLRRAIEIGPRVEPPGIVRLFVARAGAAAVLGICFVVVPSAGVVIALLG